MNLRTLTEQQEAILSQVESGDFTLDQVSDHLDLLDEERHQKIENYLHVINRLYSEECTVTAEIDRLQDIRQTKEKALSNIKNWLLLSMKDGEKHEFDLFKVSRVKGREKVNIISDKKVPMKYQVNKPESWSVDKREVLKDLKAGIEIDGAEIITGDSSLRIK
tara:strand:+ start:2727 stop:3215 length:489 start_codon:yes stop_codon:yes gene_type:complete